VGLSTDQVYPKTQTAVEKTLKQKPLNIVDSASTNVVMKSPERERTSVTPLSIHVKTHPSTGVKLVMSGNSQIYTSLNSSVNTRKRKHAIISG
jgi:hypothetical protein